MNELYKFEDHFWAATDGNRALRDYTGNSAKQSVGPLSEAIKKYKEGLRFESQRFLKDCH